MEVQVAIIKGPIFEGGARKEGGSVREVGKGPEDKRIRGRGQFDVTSKSEIQCLDNYWVGNNRSINIVEGSVNEIAMGEGVGGGHPGTREDFSDDIKVLEEEGPAGLSSR